MERLTKRQREILDFVTHSIEANHYAPSYREICDHFGLSSAATVAQHINALADKGYLDKEWNGSRSIEPTTRGKRVSHTAGALVELPLLGQVAAGYPIEAIEGRETTGVPESFLGSGEHFALKVKGDSMIEDAIRDGDLIVVSSRETARPGQTVVALIDGQEATVKRYRPEKGGMVRLEPANEKYKPIRVPEDRVRIRGIVVGVLRKY